MKKSLFKLKIALLLSFASTIGISNIPIKGRIINYNNGPVMFYKCRGDSFEFIDSTRTNQSGEFKLELASSQPGLVRYCMIKITLQQNHSFFLLSDGNPIAIKTRYQSNSEANVVPDSLVVVQSEVNKQFYEFLRLQRNVNTADFFLKQMMRLYPLDDPFHKTIENEYKMRYAEMNYFFRKHYRNHNNIATKITAAFYMPVIPDWRQADVWRDSVTAAHYFEYFNPADSFYLNSIVLADKLDHYLQIRTNKTDVYGRMLRDELILAEAASEFLEKTKSCPPCFEFCLHYILKNFSTQHLEKAFLSIYDAYAKPADGDCRNNNDILARWHEKANDLRKVQLGNIAPDFQIDKDGLWLSRIESDYILLVFWASWCPHCTSAMPELSKFVVEYNRNKTKKSLIAIAISLDTTYQDWQKFVKENNLLSFLNFSELKGWDSEVCKKYNIYSTPTFILLDREKTIVSKPGNLQQLKDLLNEKD